jgi:hypothetical protein
MSNALLILLRVINLALFIRSERQMAPHLPKWRRYLSVPPLALSAVTSTAALYVHGRYAWCDGVLVTIAIVCFMWNANTAWRRPRGDDEKRSTGERLTDVQQQSFNQQTAEAT